MNPRDAREGRGRIMPAPCLAFILLPLLFAWLPEAYAQDAGAESREALLRETASALVSLAESMAVEGRFDLASSALKCAGTLGAASSERMRIEALIAARRSGFPVEAGPLPLLDEAETLFKPESLSGWKPSRSRWEAGENGLRCISSNTDAFLHRTAGDAPARYGLSLAFTLEPGGRAGILLGSIGSGKAGILFDQEGARFFDFKAMESGESGIKVRLAPGRPHQAELVVEGEHVSARIDRKHLLSGSFTGLRHGRIALYAFGETFFSPPVRRPLEVDLLLEKGRKALRARKEEEAASLLLRARGLDGKHPEVLALLGEALVKLEFKGEAARCSRDYLDLNPDATDFAGRAARNAAEQCLREDGEARAVLASILDALTEELRARALAALDAQKTSEAGSVLDVIRSLGTHPEILRELRARIFLAERGGESAAPLLNGRDLSGWKMEGGEWKVDEKGVIEGSSDLKGRGALMTEELPEFGRFLIRTRQRGTGAYIDQGIRLMAGGEPFDIHLYKGMVGYTSLVGRKATVERGDSVVLFKSMQETGLAANEWYDVDILVDMNLATCLFNGEALFTKVLPEPVESRFGLFVEAGREGLFDAVRLMPFADDASYRAFLEEKGLRLRCVLECETVKGVTGSKRRGHAREQPFTYGGFALAGALRGGKDSPLTFRFNSLDMEDTVLSLRYSSPSGDARLGLLLDGEPLLSRLELRSTGDANDFVYCRARLGDLGAGWHSLGLLPETGGESAILDRLAITEAGDAPQEEIKVYASEAAEHFRIRLSPGMVMPGEAEEIFAILEEARAYMVDYYGYEPADPLYFNLIARECWGDPHKGGYASGDNLYVPEDTTFSNIAVIMHEMSHNFDHGNGFNPPWFGEGKSFPCYDRFVDDTAGRYRRYRNPFSLADKETGEQAFRGLEFNGENLFPYWGTARFPYWQKTPDGRDLTHLGYKASNWFCYELARFLGPAWLRDYFTLVRRDIAAQAFFMPGDRVRANSVIVDYFTRSSGRDAAAFFRRHGFLLTDIYDYDAIDVRCGEGDEDYITLNQNAKAVPAPDGEGKARLLPEGRLCYTFPVAPDSEEVLVEITWKGRGICEAEGEVLFKSGLDRRIETEACELDDSTLWEDARLTLRFTPDERRGEGLHVMRVVVKRD